MGVNLWGRTDSLLSRALDVSSQRARVLAHNIANVNTPGYKRKDIDFRAAMEQAATDKAVEVSTASAMRNDGNNVDIEREMAYVAENSIRYNSLIETLNRRLSMMRSAITEGRR